MTNLFWPELIFPPVNLLSAPNMTYTEERRRANARKLRPTRKPTKAQQPIVTPAYGEAHNMVMERMMRCLDSQKGIMR